MIAETLNRLVREFAKLPSIGEKTALRMAFYILSLPLSEAQALAQSILEVKEKLMLCSVCFNLTDLNPCAICRSERGESGTICVVQTPAHLAAFERTGQFKGTYHVLHGVISPLRNISPDDLKVRELMNRLHNGKVQEIVLAMNPTREGEATAFYLAQIIKPLALKVTRIAQGIPRGGEIEYLDESTLKSSLEGRREM